MQNVRQQLFFCQFMLIAMIVPEIHLRKGWGNHLLIQRKNGKNKLIKRNSAIAARHIQREC